MNEPRRLCFSVGGDRAGDGESTSELSTTSPALVVPDLLPAALSG